MKYEGKIYGKVAGKYIEIHTTKDLDASIKNAEKAKKYDELNAKIAEFYGDDEFDEEGDGLISIGEFVASHFGFM
jgi:hypothetical protein